MSTKDTMRESVHQVTEEMQVAGREIIGTVKMLLQDASIHRIRVFNSNTNELILDIPAIAGAGGALLFAPLAPLMLIGIVALYLMDFTVVIERRSEPIVENIEIEVESLESAAPVVDQIVVEDDVIVSVVTEEPVEIEIAPEADDEPADEPAEIEIVIEPIEEPASAVVEVTQCEGTTKSGSQCKRKPMEGSAYCYMHQPD